MADDRLQLKRYENIDSVNSDFNQKIELDVKQKTIIEYDVKNVLDVANVFELERQNTNIFRIYGSIEYFSGLNNIPTGYTSYLDFFNPTTAITKSFINDFKVYLVKPYGYYDDTISGQTGFTKLDNNLYIKRFQVITDLTNFEIYNAGYDKNLFGERRYSFNFNIDADLTEQYDGLYFPITELYLYVEYQPKLNGSGYTETMKCKLFDNSGNTIITAFTPTLLNIGDLIVGGDVIEYDKENFTQTTVNMQEHYIYTPCTSGATDIEIKWKYDPLISIQINVFNDELELVNATGTSYEEITSIPVYATPIGNENYVWRNLQEKSFFDPLTNAGTSFPFINQRHYVFDNYMVKLTPDLSDDTTYDIFSNIIFENNELLSNQPITKAINFGDPC